MGFEEHKRKGVFVFVFIFLLVLAFLMFKPYLNAIIVGALLAYFLQPVYLRLVKIFKSETVTLILLSVVTALVLIGLLLAIALPLASQTQFLYLKSGQLVTSFVQDVKNCDELSSTTATCQLSAKFTPLIESPQFRQRSNEFLQKVSFYISEKLGDLLNGIVSFLISFLVMIFSLFYFLDHGKEIETTILGILPLSKSDKRRIIQRLEESIRAVVGGNVLTAFLQGVVASLIFLALGVSAPLFWGLIIAVLAFIPGIGPSIVWIPLTAIFVIKGDLPRAIILVASSLLILTPIETILKPRIIGKKIKMSTFAVFMGVLGGIHFFGILGFFLGPIILALLTTCIQIYREMDGHSSE